MKLTCTVSRLASGKWLARHTGSSTGQVEVTAPTREEALTKNRYNSSASLHLPVKVASRLQLEG
jgi:hypothetical protein